MLALHACNIRIKETDLELQHTTGISVSFWSCAFFQEKSGRVLYLKPEIKIKCGDRLTLWLRLIVFKLRPFSQNEKEDKILTKAKF